MTIIIETQAYTLHIHTPTHKQNTNTIRLVSTESLHRIRFLSLSFPSTLPPSPPHTTPTLSVFFPSSLPSSLPSFILSSPHTPTQLQHYPFPFSTFPPRSFSLPSSPPASLHSSLPWSLPSSFLFLLSNYFPIFRLPLRVVVFHLLFTFPFSFVSFSLFVPFTRALTLPMLCCFNYGTHNIRHLKPHALLKFKFKHRTYSFLETVNIRPQHRRDNIPI